LSFFGPKIGLFVLCLFVEGTLPILESHPLSQKLLMFVVISASFQRLSQELVEAN